MGVLIYHIVVIISHYQFSPSVAYDSLQPHELQHTRIPYPSLSPGICAVISLKSVMPSKHLNIGCPLLLLSSIFPSTRVFSNELVLRIMWPKYWSASASVLPMIIYGWFPLGLTGLIFLQSKGLLRVFSSTTVWKHQFFSIQLYLWSNSLTSIQHYWKNHSFDYMKLFWQNDAFAF